jgi:hypothetical protein
LGTRNVSFSAAGGKYNATQESSVMDIFFRINIFSFSWEITIGKQWVRLGVITVTLLLSAMISYWVPTRYTQLVLVSILGLGGLVLLLRQPELGIMLIFPASMFVPFAGPGGINATLLVVAMLTGLWILDMLVGKREFAFAKSRVMLPVVAFMIVSLLSFLMGRVPWFLDASQAPLETQVGGLFIFLLSACALLVTAHTIKDIRWLEWIVYVFIGLGALYIIGRFVHSPFHERLYQSGFTAGSMFWTWMVALALGQVIFNTRLRNFHRALLVGVVLVTLYVAFVQAYDWKSGWVPPLVAVAVLLALRFPKLAILAAPFGVFLAIFLTGELIASDEYSWGTRVDAWIIVLEITKTSPLLGLGFGNYYWYTPLIPIRGWRVSFNSHSQFVDIIAQTGIIGMAVFMWIFVEVGLLSNKLTKKLPDGFGRAYAYSVIGGVAGTMMAAFLVDWVLPFVYNIGMNGFRASILPWIFLGGLVSLEQITRKQEVAAVAQ